MNFSILQTVSIDNIELHSVLDKEQDDVHLAVSDIDPKGSKTHKILQGLGYSQSNLMQKISVVTEKIETYTTSPENPHQPIHPSR